MAFSSPDKQQPFKLTLTDDEWKAKLTPEQYRVLRQKATESAYTGYYNKHFEKGIYRCAGCGHPLFEQVDKYLTRYISSRLLQGTY